MFLINSRLGRFAATPAGSARLALHLQGHSFSRSYGVVMPSSLTMVLPIASVYSTRLPVSVLVRAPSASLEVFLGSMDSPASASAFVSRLGDLSSAGFHALPPTCFHGDVQNPARLSFSVAPSVVTARGGTGISTCCASATPVGLALAPD